MKRKNNQFDYESARWIGPDGKPIKFERKNVSEKRLLNAYLTALDKGLYLEDLIRIQYKFLTLAELKDRIKALKEKAAEQGYALPDLQRRPAALKRPYREKPIDFKMVAKKFKSLKKKR